MDLSQCLASTWYALYISVIIIISSTSSIVPTEGAIILEPNWPSINRGYLIDLSRPPLFLCPNVLILMDLPLKFLFFLGIKEPSEFSSGWSRNNK